MNLILKRYDRFKQELDGLITEYSDLSYKELTDALEYYANIYHRKALKEEYTEQISANSCKTCKDEQKPIEREEFTSIPFGAYDSELVNETITIPDGCYATIEGNRIHIKKK